MHVFIPHNSQACGRGSTDVVDYLDDEALKLGPVLL